MSPVGRTGSRLGAPGDAIPDQIVVHVDCDCFYAACERRREPKLRDRPVVVGMGYDRAASDGAVATASYDAREYGVEAAMPIAEAQRHLPRMVDADPADPDAPDPESAGHYRPVDMDYYEAVGEKLRAVLAAHADVLEPISIDEAFLDVTDRLTWADMPGFVKRLQTTIREEIGIPVSIGVTPTKSAAKIAADEAKPAGTMVVEPGDVVSFLAPLSVAVLPGVGPVTETALSEEGIETVGGLADADPTVLADQFGRRGRRLHRRARGIDSRQVTPPDDPKSLSKEQSFSDPLTETAAKETALRELVEAVTDRAQDRGVLYQTVGIKIIEPPYEVSTRAESLPGPIDDPAVVHEVAAALLSEFAETPIRKLGVRLSKLSITDTEQPTLAAWSSEQGRPQQIEAGGRQATLQEFDSCKSS